MSRPITRCKECGGTHTPHCKPATRREEANIWRGILASPEAQARKLARQQRRQHRYTVLGGSRGTIKHCWALLTDPDGFQARCLVPWGTAHSHHDATARELVAQRQAKARTDCYEP